MAKVIKLQNGSTTLLPITDSSYVQYKTTNNQYTSVKQALDQLAGVGHSLGDDDQTLSYVSGTGLQLSHTNGNSDTVTLNGSSEISLSGATDSVTFNHTTHSISAVTPFNKNITGDSQKVITGISVNAYGHVTGYTAANVSSTDTNTYNVIDANYTTGLKIASIDPDNGTASTGSDTALYVPIGGSALGVVKSGATSGKIYGVSIDTNGAMTVNVPWTDTVPDYSNTYAAKTHSHQITWSADSNYTPSTDTVNVLTYFNSATTLNNNGTAEYTTATVPTKKYVDEVVTNIGSALAFCGKVDGSHALPTNNLKVGMTYLVGSAGTFGGQSCEPGDMLISYYDTAYHWAVVQANWTATDGTATLSWGNTTTLATIGGVTIDATMPAKPTLSSSKSGTGNFIKQITVSDHAITYVLDYAYSKLSGSGSGVVTSITGSNDTITVSYTDLTVNKVGGAANTYIKSVQQAANGKVTVETGTLPTHKSLYFNGNGDNQVDVYDPTGANAKTLKAGAGIQMTASSNVITIKHSHTDITSTSTEDIRKFKYDAQGHITGATAVTITSDTPVDSVTSNMKYVELATAPDLNTTWLTDAGLTGTTETQVVTSTTSTNYVKTIA